MSQRFEGKSLDEALTIAAGTLGVERHQLTYHVMLEKRGFLGGVKHVVVEAEVNVSAAGPAPPVAEALMRPRASGAPARLPSQGRPSGGPGGGRQRSGRGDGGGRDRGRPSRGGGRGGHRRDESDLRSGDFEHFAMEEAPVQGAESEAAGLVHAWLEEVLDIAKLHIDVRTEENEAQLLITLYGKDAPRLLDDHGELLDALQVLANKSLTGRKVEKDIELDSQRFKSRRTEDLGKRARDLAERVRVDGREQLFPAMTPIERRIIHLALQEDADVTTESRGDGFYKRVAVVPRQPSAGGGQPTTES